MGFLKKIFSRLGNSQSRHSETSTVNAREVYNKGVDCIQNDDWKAAMMYLEESAEKDPEFSSCWYAMGITYGKLMHGGGSEEEMSMHMNKMCSFYQKAVDLSDKYGDLQPEHYHKAAATIGAMRRIEKKYDQALPMFKKALEKIPDDTDIMEAIALCLFEKGDLDKAEQSVSDLLNANPDSEGGRKLWKKIRKKSGKSLAADFPEEKRKEIYSSYMSIQDNELLLKSDLLEDTKKADSIGGIRDVLNNASKRSTEKAEKTIQESHKITAFDLRLIIEEGKRNAWPFSSIMQLGADRPQPQRAAFRDSLQCVNCGKRNVTTFWPENGDMVAFYFQSEEDTQGQPGAFRLPVECPFCKKTWFVVWDDNPDSAAGQFLRHIERMCEAYSSNVQAIKTLRGMIDDGILGEHMKFIKKELKSVIEHEQTAEHSATNDEYFSTLTIVPASDPALVCRYLGGLYFAYMESILAKADMNLRNIVHWVLACGEETVAVHMTFIPRKSNLSKLPTILPVDLLTQQEREQAGL